MKLYLSILGLILTLVFPLTEIPKLIFVEQYLRHGQKYPQPSYSNETNQYYLKQKMTLGAITNIGRANCYLMGKKMYEVYWQQLFKGTSNEKNLNLSKILVKSTILSRTIESAQAYLFGMLQSLSPLTITQKQAELIHPPYPGIKAKAGNVFGQKGKGYHTVPINLVDQCLFGSYFLRKSLIKKNLQSKFSLKIQQYPSFRNSLDSFQKKLNISNQEYNFDIFHRYYINEISQISMGKKSVLLQHSQMTRALKAMDCLLCQVKYYTNQLQMNADSTPWIRQLISNINNYVSNPSSPQIVIFSTHQVAIGTIFAAFKLWTAECIFQSYLKNVSHPQGCITDFPTFGSVFAVEVYEYSNKSHTFKLNYNGKQLPIPICKNQKECALERLQRWFDSWKVPQEKEGCHTSNQFIERHTTTKNLKFDNLL